MKLDCVLTACNKKPLYLNFIPIFIKAWTKLYPNVSVKIILISNDIPIQFKKYKNNIILFKPLPNISTAFISQYIRLLYPAILNYKNGIMITDIDILPMNRVYYTKNIKNIDNSKFIYLRNVCLNNKQIAMCYNVGLNKTWGDIFNIKTIKDISKRLKDVFIKINYADKRGQSGWATDQIHFYKYVMNWNKRKSDFILLLNNKTGFKRLDRNTFKLNKKIKQLIKSGYYSDYHCYMSYNKYKYINDTIVELL